MSEPVVIRIELMECDDVELQALGAITHLLNRTWGPGHQLDPKARARIVQYLTDRYREGG
jgi:hypothetical protein